MANEQLEQQADVATRKPKEQAPSAIKIPEKLNKRIPEFYLFRLLRKIEPISPNGWVHGGPFVIPSESSILWAYHDAEGDKEEKPFGVEEYAPADHTNFQVRRTRYIPNIASIFVDEQKGVGERVDGQRHAILDNIQRAEKLTFSRNELRVKSTEKNLYNFLRTSSQISNPHPNAKSLRNINPVFELVDFAYMDEVVVKKGQTKQKAYELALTARDLDVLPHAKFLNIALKDLSGIDRSMEAIRAEYNEIALTSPDMFINSFNDPKTKILYNLRILSEHNEIAIENATAYWAKTRSFITQISPGREPFEFLAEFSLTTEGQEFSNNIRGVYNDLKARNKNNSSFI